MQERETKKDDTYDADFKRYFKIFCGAVSIICILPLILTQCSWGISIGATKPNEIGDAIGGTLGPMVALLASGLTFLAFWVQYKANRQQQRDIEQQQKDIIQQRKDIAIDRFENKFYEMLRLHNDTVKEIEIAGRHSGRKAFTYLFDEFRFVYRIIENELENWNSLSDSNKSVARLSYDKEKIAELAYTMFFFGVGEQSNRATFYRHQVHTPFYLVVKKQLEKMQLLYRRDSGNGKYVRIIYSVYPAIDVELNYVPFDGHVSKLGHYYRHLYQMVKFIRNQVELDDPYFFMKTLRAQLSNHEQLLLYYNSFFATGWWTEKLFLDSRIIKNIPLYLTDVGPSPEEKFKTELMKIKEGALEKAIRDELAKQLEWYKPEETAKV
jgi:hypothetical protein